MAAILLDEYAPYDTGPGSHATEGMWRKFMRNAMTGGNGVLRGLLDEFETYADSTGMHVKVKAGEAWIMGQWGHHASEKQLTIPAADPTNPRLDRVVVRNDFVNDRMELDVITGTPAASPVAPDPTRDASIYEVPVALVSVGAGVVTIAAGDVTYENERELMSPTATHHQWASGSTEASQLVPNDTLTKVQFPITFFGDYNVRKAANNTDFTFGRSGLWTVTASCTWAAESANGGSMRHISMTKSDDVNWKYATSSVPGNQATGTPVAVSVTRTRMWTAGETVSIYAWQRSGGDKWIEHDWDDGPVLISFTWMGY